MKKGLISFLIVILLTNFIFFNTSYADEHYEGYTWDKFEKADQDSAAGIGDSDMSIAPAAQSANGTIIGFLVSFYNIPPMLLQVIASAFVGTMGVIGNGIDDSSFSLIYIRNIITGKYVLLDANIFRDLTKPRSQGGAELASDDIMIRFRNNIKMWFIIIRDLAIAINLCMLIYIAIRMATITIAQDRAKYKEMLYNWAVSMIILFMLPYLMSIINYSSDILTNFANKIMDTIDNSGNANVNFEEKVTNNAIENVFDASGMQAAANVIIYWILLWNQMKFLLRYIKRAFTAFFLIVIAPLITVTYAVDKIADRQAQAFNKWLHEYLINMFVQPIHCFTYMVFMYMANNIAQTAPIVAIIFLISLSKAEKIVISILGLSGVTMKHVGDEMNFGSLTGKLRGLIPKGVKPGMGK